MPNDNRFATVPLAVVYDADGNRVENRPAAELDRAEAQGEAWDLYWQTGDDSRLKELGLIPSD